MDDWLEIELDSFTYLETHGRTDRQINDIRTAEQMYGQTDADII